MASRSLRMRSVPSLGFAQAGAGGFFDDAGFPAGQGGIYRIAGAIRARPRLRAAGAGRFTLPLYRDGDVLIVEPGATIRKGDRVVVKTTAGEVMAKVLSRRTRRVDCAGVAESRSPGRDRSHARSRMGGADRWASQ